MANKYGNDSAYAIAGLFHDTLEDGFDMTIPELKQEIRMTFPNADEETIDAAITAIVLLTRKKDTTYNAYIINLSYNKIAREVKLADLDHNMRKRPTPPNDSLMARYAKAEQILLDAADNDGLKWHAVQFVVVVTCIIINIYILIKLFT